MRGSADGCGCFPTGRHYAAIAHLLRTQVQGLAPGFDVSDNWIDQDIVMVDVETTGRVASSDRIVELAIVRGRKGEVVSRNAWLINPQRPIPAEVTAVHGITDADVEDKPTFANVCHEILAALQGAIPAAYNASFDRGFVHAEVASLPTIEGSLPPALMKDVEWIDPLVWARHIQATARSRALGDVAARLSVELDHAHRATADAEAALKILYKFASDSRVPASYGGMVHEQLRLSKSQEEARQMWRGRGN
jgi:DNA polymerase III subunit epsilon